MLLAEKTGSELDGVSSIPPDAFKVVCLLRVLLERSGKLAENVRRSQ